MLSPIPDIRQRLSEVEPGMTLGVEQEFELFDRGRQLDFRTEFPRLIRRAASIPFRNCESAALVEAGYMLCCDGRDAEFATAPIELKGSGPIDLANEVVRCRGHLLQTLRKLGLREVRGYSTHLSISAPAGRERELAEAAAVRIGPALILLMEGPRSPGLLIRTRRGRLEVGSEYMDDEQRLAAAVVLLAGLVHAYLYHQAAWEQLPALKLKHWEEAITRPGLYLPHDAYGASIHALGRAASLDREGGGSLTAGGVLEACAALAKCELEGLTSPESLRTLERALDQPALLPIEGKFDVGRVASRRSNFTALQSRTLKMLARSRGRRLTPRFVDWEGAAFEWRNAGHRLIIGMPWSQLPVLFAAAQTDKVLGAIAGAQTPKPLLNSLDQLGSPQAFQRIDPVSLGTEALSDKGGPGGVIGGSPKAVGGNGGSPGPGGAKGGSPKPPGQLKYVDQETYIPAVPPRRAPLPLGLIGLLIGVLVLLVGTLTLTGVLNLPRGGPSGSGGPPNPSVTGSPSSGSQGSAALAQGSSTPACVLQLISPASADQIPETGALTLQWSNVPGAASYALKVIPPPSFSLPWIFPAKGTTRTIYMENFTAAGEYQFSVEALDPSGGVLCGTEMKFKRSALQAPPPRSGEGGGGGACAPSILGRICP